VAPTRLWQFEQSSTPLGLTRDQSHVQQNLRTRAHQQRHLKDSLPHQHRPPLVITTLPAHSFKLIILKVLPTDSQQHYVHQKRPSPASSSMAYLAPSTFIARATSPTYIGGGGGAVLISQAPPSLYAVVWVWVFRFVVISTTITAFVLLCCRDVIKECSNDEEDDDTPLVAPPQPRHSEMCPTCGKAGGCRACERQRLLEDRLLVVAVQASPAGRSSDLHSYGACTAADTGSEVRTAAAAEPIIDL